MDDYVTALTHQHHYVIQQPPKHDDDDFDFEITNINKTKQINELTVTGKIILKKIIFVLIIIIIIWIIVIVSAYIWTNRKIKNFIKNTTT